VVRGRAALLLGLLLPGCSGAGPRPIPPFVPNFLAAEVRLDQDAPGAAWSLQPRIRCSSGIVYVVWIDQRSGLPDVYFRRSLDSGATWQPELRLDADVPGAASSTFVRIAVSDSLVHVAWVESRSGATDVYYRRSSDAGATWGPEIRLDTDVAGAAASDALDLEASGQLVAAAWADARSGATDVRFNRSLDGGLTWLALDLRLETGDAAGATESGAPRLDCSGQRVLCVWEDRRSGPHDVFCRRSADGGTTWPDPETRMDTDAAGAAFSRLPKVTSSGSNVAVVWQDSRNVSSDDFLRRSPDGGLTWAISDQRVDSDAPGASISDLPQPWIEGESLCIGWMDSRNGGYLKPWARRSVDAGATWPDPELKLDVGAMGSQHANGLRIAGAGRNVYAVWLESRTGPTADIFLNFSTDRGATWAPPDLRLDTDAAGSANSFWPEICVEGVSVYVVWEDRRNGTSDIYFRRSVP
jgi:Neuraminidase (sialidase)